MDYIVHHHIGATSLEAAGRQATQSQSVIKIGLDVHAVFYVAAAQYDHATPGAPRQFTPEQFVHWVRSLARPLSE